MDMIGYLSKSNRCRDMPHLLPHVLPITAVATTDLLLELGLPTQSVPLFLGISGLGAGAGSDASLDTDSPMDRARAGG